MSPEVGKMRAVFNDIKKKFRDAGVKYSLFFPARLGITVDGIRHTFDSPQTAQKSGLLQPERWLKKSKYEPGVPTGDMDTDW